jgi:hypothetical protein
MWTAWINWWGDSEILSCRNPKSDSAHCWSTFVKKQGNLSLISMLHIFRLRFSCAHIHVYMYDVTHGETYTQASDPWTAIPSLFYSSSACKGYTLRTYVHFSRRSTDPSWRAHHVTEVPSSAGQSSSSQVWQPLLDTRLPALIGSKTHPVLASWPDQGCAYGTEMPLSLC